MSDSNWGARDTTFYIVITLLLALVAGYGLWELASLHSKEAAKAEQRSSQYAKDTEKQILDACNMTELSALRQCVTERVQASEENQRATKDLVAQDVTARWTFGMFWLGVTGSLLSLVGIYYLRANLDEMKGGREDAQAAIAAANNANQISRETGRDQSRAYVFVNAAELYFLSESEPKVTVLLSVKNNGSTPAKWFCVRSAVDICEGCDPPEAPPFEGVTWNALGGGDTLTVGARSDPNTFDFTFDCRDSIICRGEVEYETFFGEVFVSEFAFIAHPRFRIRFEPTTVSPESSPYVQITTRGKEISTKMSRVAGSLKTFHKKT